MILEVSYATPPTIRLTVPTSTVTLLTALDAVQCAADTIHRLLIKVPPQKCAQFADLRDAMKGNWPFEANSPPTILAEDARMLKIVDLLDFDDGLTYKLILSSKEPKKISNRSNCVEF